ncbi:MAG: preprotein translocase subunit SecE [Cycloclasticus sp. symbiont of Poecilosclerida sp. M]|nr:MAG: preprotein translocase subunit SecE [Cycloclasticus sp. symbiont of Poecilosclerida sp. M]
MSVESEQISGQFDTVKLILALFMMVAGVAGFYYFAEHSLLLRVISLLGALGVAIVFVFTTNLGRGFWLFGQGSMIELRKVVWPTKKETIQTTLIVMVMVLFVGILLWVFDNLLSWGIGMVIGQGG